MGKGIGFYGGLTILFVALKLTDHIDWSWFWVIFPVLMPFFILLLSIGAWMIIHILHRIETISRKKERDKNG